MKNTILLLPLALLLLASCSGNRYATTGQYEADEVYYSPGETFISDFALVDDEERMGIPQESTPSYNYDSDDYYQDSTSQSGSVINNYYGDVYQSPWGNTPGYGNSPFGNYCYGSYWNNWGPSYSLGWSPWSGWYTSFNYGWNFGMNNSWNWGYPGYGWYSPYYNPWCYNSWAFYNWNSPFNYYNPGFYGSPYNTWGGSAWFDGTPSDVDFGPRNPISVSTGVNSTYSDDVFYSGVKEKPNAKPMLTDNSLVSPLNPVHSISPSTNPNLSNTFDPIQPGSTVQKPQVVQENSSAIVSLNSIDEEIFQRPSTLKPSQVQLEQSTSSVKPKPTYNYDRPKPSSVSTSSGKGSINTSNVTSPIEQARTQSRANDKVIMNEPVRSERPQQNNNRPQDTYNRPQTKPQTTDRPASKPNYQPEKSPSRQEPQRNEQPEIRQPKAPEQKPVNKPSQPERIQTPSRPSSPPSSPSPSRSGGGGGGGSVPGPRRK